MILPGATLFIVYLLNKRRTQMICSESMDGPTKVRCLDLTVTLQVLAVKCSLDTLK